MKNARSIDFDWLIDFDKICNFIFSYSQPICQKIKVSWAFQLKKVCSVFNKTLNLSLA